MSFSLIKEQEEFISLLERSGKSFNTVKNYRADLQCFNHFLADKKNDFKLKEFTMTQVNEYAEYLLQKYPSANSLRRRVQALRLFFDFLVGKNLFPENPIKKMPVSPKVLDKPSPNTFSEVNKTYKHLVKRFNDAQGMGELVALRNIILFHLIYGAGLKVSDLHFLKMNDVIKDKKGSRLLVQHPKRDPYSIPLPEVFSTDFKLYELKRKEYQVDMDELFFNANAYKIISPTLSPRGIELIFEELSRQLGFKMTAKTLRQSCIFKWMIQRQPPSTIKEWLGVAPQYSMELYLQVFDEQQEIMVFKDLSDSLIELPSQKR